MKTTSPQMKMTMLRIAIAAAALFTMPGCMTAMRNYGNSWSGHPATPSEVVGAAVLDVATAPLQVPCWAYVGASSAKSKIDRAKQERELRKRFVEDASFRHQFIHSKGLLPGNLTVLSSKDASDVLTEDDVRYLWTRFKGVTGGHGGTFHELLIARNTPPDVLAEIYPRLLEQAVRRDGKPDPRVLIRHERFLLHPNLSPAVIREIQSCSNNSVNQILKRRRA